MKYFFNRYAYIFIGFIPVLIYFFSYLLFEMNSESSLQIKQLFLETIAKVRVSPIIKLNEYKSRILWQSSSLLSILVYLCALVWSLSILYKCCSSRAQIKKILSMGTTVVILTLLQVGAANSGDAMYNTIFSTTYEAIQTSSLYQQPFQHYVHVVIIVINILAAMTPVIILIALCSTISLPDTETVPDVDFFIDRMNYLKQGIAMGSIVMLFGIIHMAAWMQWPVALLEGTEDNDLNKAFLSTVSATCQFWGITFSLLLISLYGLSTVFLRTQVQNVMNNTFSASENKRQWLEENGFTISFQKHAIQLGMMLTPFLAGSYSSVFGFVE